MPIKRRTAKAPTKPSAVAKFAYQASIASCGLYTAAILTLLIATLINPDIGTSEGWSTWSTVLQLALAAGTLGALAAFILALIALLQPNHPRPRTHAKSAALLSAFMLTISALLLLMVLA